MEKFQANLTEVANMLDPNTIPMKGNESRLIRVAFDLFRLDGDEADDLWQLQADDDGAEFLVRTYSMPDDEEMVAEASDWSVLADKKYANLTVSFKGLPLTRIASKDYGAETPHDGKTLQGIVFNKLSSDGEFIFHLIADLPKEKRMALRQAGLLDDLKSWLQSKDVTEPIIEKITALVEERVPEFKEKPEDDEKAQWDSAFSGMSEKAEDFSSEEVVGVNADDEWRLAFLDLSLKKTAKSVAPYVGPIESQTEKNKNFRKVLFTGDHSQLVVMSLKGSEELGSEVHKSVDQFFRIEEGEAIFVLDGKKKRVKAGGGVVIPSGTEHNVINASDTELLQLYTIYSPPNHPPGTIHKTKADAEKAEEKKAGLGISLVANVQDNSDFYHPGADSSGVDLVNMSNDMTQNVDNEPRCPKCKKRVESCRCPECDVCGQPPSECQCGN